MNRKRISIDEYERSAFFQLPKFLVYADEFAGLSCEAMVLYSLLKSRHELSRKNGWINERGEVYLIMTREEMGSLIRKSKPTVIKAMKDLKKYGLVDEERLGLGKPNLIFLLEPVTIKTVETPQEPKIENQDETMETMQEPKIENPDETVEASQKSNFFTSASKDFLPQKSKILTSAEQNFLPQDGKNFDPIYNNFRYTDYRENESVSQSVSQEKTDRQIDRQINNKIEKKESNEEATIKALEKKGYKVIKTKELVNRPTKEYSQAINKNLLLNDTAKQNKSQYIKERYTIEYIKDLFYYDYLVEQYRNYEDTINSCFQILYDALNSTQPIKIGKQEKPNEVVISKLMKLNYDDIIYSIEQFNQQTDRIKNPRGYLLTILYNSKEQQHLDLKNLGHYNGDF